MAEKSPYHDSSYGSEDERTNSQDSRMDKETLGIKSDVEAQNRHVRAQSAATIAPEYQIPTSTKYLYLALYFGLNLTLTLYNKAVLGKFAFPWLLTTLHTTSASLGCYILMLRGHFKLSKLTTRENLVLISFSFLFTVNIAISNVSLAMVSVPFHQIMRSTCPIFTILIYRFFYGRTYSQATYISLIPVILGVGLATYGDYYFTGIGFTLTLLGVVLSAFKTVMSNRIMTGSLALPALEILLRMSPLAAVQSLLYAFATGEASAFSAWVAEGNLTPSYSSALLGNGLLAFLLNVSSFQTNKLAGALTMTVCANLKQCLTVLLGIALFDVTVGVWNGAGMLVTLLGAAIYSKVELDSKGKKAEATNAKDLRSNADATPRMS
ncbi:UAA transporter [Imshaugia aleurites]|uniref:UAA transporter n=1 Tax=Imshaugia aleurites TaxID=172621 RepID=A0A8H3IQ93_9LECA|nr:UAA transporter [Imshaugia aleurites]